MTETATEYETPPDPFAVGIASAQAQLDAATEAHQQAQRKEGTIKARLKVLADERAAIIKSRDRETLNADDDEKHAQRLALITADTERLAELLVPATEAVRQAGQQVAVASARVREAHAEHARHVAQQQADALTGRLQELEKMLLRGIAQLAELKRAASPRTVHLVASEVFKASDGLVRFIVQGVVPH